MKTSEDKIIVPTIGRRVWYWPSSLDRGLLEVKPTTIIEADVESSGQPCDAGVVRVFNDRLVNLSVTDHNGNVHKRLSVTLYQPGDHVTHSDGGYATWMDYQVQQALAITEPKIEQASTKAGNQGPRVTRQDIEDAIVFEHYFTASDGIVGRLDDSPQQRHPTDAEFASLDQVTICMLMLKNGTKIVGVNHGHVSPENFDPELGRTYAREKAIEQIWPLLGYQLLSALHEIAIAEAPHVLLRTDDPAVDLRNVVGGLPISPNAVQHTEDPDDWGMSQA